MKFKDLIRFIEDEVEQSIKAKKPMEQKPVTINIKREEKKQKEKELEEMDFEELMFHKLDESLLRERIKKILNETILLESSFEIYHNSFSKACQEAIDYATNKGYEVDSNDWFTQVSTGPRKPDPGSTNKYSVELTKTNLPSNKKLHFQVYGMESGKYELNTYIQ